MRKRTILGWVLFFSLVLISWVLTANGQTPRSEGRRDLSAPDLIQYTSPDQSFEAAFRGVPEYKEAETDDAMTTVAFTPNDRLLSMVSVYSLKPDVQIEARQYLRNYESRILKEKKRIEADSDIEVSGVTGKEYKISSFDSYEILRLFVIGNRVFEIKWAVANWLTMPQRTKTEFLAEAQRFMNSFKILHDPR